MAGSVRRAKNRNDPTASLVAFIFSVEHSQSGTPGDQAFSRSWSSRIAAALFRRMSSDCARQSQYGTETWQVRVLKVP